MKYSVLIAASLFCASPALADGGYIAPVANEATQTECSACHVAYQPAFLPARSWQTIMGTLDDHFGENAQLDEATRAEIEAYLIANAADAGGRKFRGVAADVTPIRITELSWFVHEHSEEVSPRMRERAGSMANCTACHRGAEKGMFDDD